MAMKKSSNLNKGKIYGSCGKSVVPRMSHRAKGQQSFREGTQGLVIKVREGDEAWQSVGGFAQH